MIVLNVNMKLAGAGLARFGAVALLPLLVLSGGGLALADEPQVTLDRILDTWRQRQERVLRGRFVWSQTSVMFPNIMWTAEQGWVPKEMRRFENDGLSFAFDGEKYAYRTYTQVVAEKVSVTQCTAYTYDGKHPAAYYPPLGNQPAEGQIRSGQRFREFSNWRIWPFLLTFRPLAGIAELGITRERLTLSDAPVTVLGTDCVALEWDPRTLKGLRRRILVELQPPHRARRLEQLYFPDNVQAEYLVGSLEFIDYLQHDEWLHVPAAWRIDQKTGDGADMELVEARLQNYSLNEPLPDEEFTLVPFPEGTYVIDEVGGRDYWQRANGQIEIARPAPPPTPQPDPTSRFWIVAGALAPLAAFGLWLAVKRLRGRRLGGQAHN